MSAKFESGQTVYGESGERAEYVTKTADGHIVRPIVEAYSGDGDEEYDHVCQPTLWHHVFSKAPVEKYSDELKTLHQQIAAARAERRQIESEESQRQRDRAAKLKRFAILDTLEDFIDGKITHYVTRESYGPPEIVSVEQAICTGDRYRTDLRLLTLGGNLRNGGITWLLNQYSDGSGSPRGVIPCTSLGAAQDIVREKVVAHFAKTSDSPRADWIAAAEKLEVAVPNAYRLAVARERIKALESNSAYTRKQADDYAKSVRDTDIELASLRELVAQAAGEPA